MLQHSKEPQLALVALIPVWQQSRWPCSAANIMTACAQKYKIRTYACITLTAGTASSTTTSQTRRMAGIQALKGLSYMPSSSPAQQTRVSVKEPARICIILHTLAAGCWMHCTYCDSTSATGAEGSEPNCLVVLTQLKHVTDSSEPVGPGNCT